MPEPTNTHFHQQALVDRDLKHLWHPCTQMKDHEKLPVIPIRSGNGVWLEDISGKKYLDAISSWWVNLFGHRNPYINERIKQQLDQLEHVILAGFTHQPIIELSERLVQLAPPNLSKCFYADNGSCAVEVALKMSFHYWKNTGKFKKNRFMCLSNSYHGETLGTLSVSDVALYKDIYGPLLQPPITTPGPDCYYREPGETWEAYSLRAFEKTHTLLQQHHEELSAIIVEPLVQCAGHMRMYHHSYLAKLRQACDEFQVHLIADEIAVGFGRTGTLFACEQAEISPDFLCLSKGLTGGYLPLSVVMTSQKTFDAFYDDYNTLKAFLHSHSYTGNPLACTAALATLDLFSQENTLQKNQALSKAMWEHATKFVDHPNVSDVRQQGMILAIELVKKKQLHPSQHTPYPWQERRGLKAYQHALSRGILLRPLSNVLYWMPPYVITLDELSLLAEVTGESIEVATQSL